MKTNSIYKLCHNRALDMFATLPCGSELPSEPAMAKALGVSRTTIRAVLAELSAKSIVVANDGSRKIARLPALEDYLADEEVELLSDMVERKFMTWMVGPDCNPGDVINGLDLARQFGVSTSAIRECLNRLSHFGLLERQSNGRWRVLGLTNDFVAELFDMREIIELRAADRFVMLSPGHELWNELSNIQKEHHELLADFEQRQKDFSNLDHRFHRLIGSAAPNRFLDNVQSVMSLIFHYHYQWNKKDESSRNLHALNEHLAYMEGLKSGDRAKARAVCKTHLKTARETLLRSIRTEGDTTMHPGHPIQS